MTCKQCKWYKVPHKGNSCIDSGKKPSDEECKEFQEATEADLFTPEELKDNPFVKDSMKLLDKPGLKIDSDLEAELRSMFSKVQPGTPLWNLPKIVTTMDDLSALVDIHRESQAYKDRILSVKLDLIPIQSKLERIRTNTEAWLYHWSSISELKSEHMRATSISFVIAPLEERMDRCSNLIKMCEMISKYLDNLHFTIVEIKDLSIRILDEQKSKKREM